MHLSRLHGRKVVDRVRRRGETWKGKHMKIIYLSPRDASTRQRHVMLSEAVSESEGLSRSTKALPAQHDVPQFFVGTLASTHLHKSAVKRNRMRRRCREALRIVLQATSYKLQADVQLLIAPRSSSLTSPFEELLQDIRSFLKHLESH